MYILLSISLFPSSTCVINQCFGCFVTENNSNSCNTEKKIKNNSFLFGILVSIIIHTIKKRHLMIVIFKFYKISSLTRRRALTIDMNIQTYTRLTDV